MYTHMHTHTHTQMYTHTHTHNTQAGKRMLVPPIRTHSTGVWTLSIELSEWTF